MSARELNAARLSACETGTFLHRLRERAVKALIACGGDLGWAIAAVVGFERRGVFPVDASTEAVAVLRQLSVARRRASEARELHTLLLWEIDFAERCAAATTKAGES